MKSKELNLPNINLLIFIVFSSCNNSQSFRITFKNPNPVELNTQVVVVSRKILENKVGDDAYYPFQMDGPARENDKGGFRLYFDGRNAKDMFAKRQPKLEIHFLRLLRTGIS